MRVKANYPNAPTRWPSSLILAPNDRPGLGRSNELIFDKNSIEIVRYNYPLQIAAHFCSIFGSTRKFENWTAIFHDSRESFLWKSVHSIRIDQGFQVIPKGKQKIVSTRSCAGFNAPRTIISKSWNFLDFQTAFFFLAIRMRFFNENRLIRFEWILAFIWSQN